MVRTPDEYVQQCEAAFALGKFLPRPESHEEVIALDKAHPPGWNAGWGDVYAGFIPDEWYSHRPPPPAPPAPEPPALTDDEKSRLLNTLLNDPEFRKVVKTIVQGAA